MSYFIGGRASFWRSRLSRNDGNHTYSDASFMLYTKPKVSFAYFNDGKYPTNGGAGHDVFLPLTGLTCNMGKKGICRLVITQNIKVIRPDHII
jgi:hypothetical protein